MEEDAGQAGASGSGAAAVLWRLVVVLALAAVLAWLSVRAMPRIWWSGEARGKERFSADVFVVRAAGVGGDEGGDAGAGDGDRAGEGAGFEILDLELESADRLTRLIVERAEDVAKARVEAVVAGAGPGHTFRRIERQVIEVDLLSERAAWSEAELEGARRAVAAWARERSPRVVAVGLAEGDVDRVRVDARGLALNVGTVVLVVLALVQLARLPGAVVAVRARRRAVRGVCGACGYEIGGLVGELERERAADVVEVTCPECGAVVRV